MANPAFSDSDPRLQAYVKQQEDEAQKALELDRELYTYNEAAQLLGISKVRLRQYVNNPMLGIDPRLVGTSRNYWITAADIKKIWVKRHQVFIVKKNKDQVQKPQLIPIIPPLLMATA